MLLTEPVNYLNSSVNENGVVALFFSIIISIFVLQKIKEYRTSTRFLWDFCRLNKKDDSSYYPFRFKEFTIILSYYLRYYLGKYTDKLIIDYNIENHVVKDLNIIGLNDIMETLIYNEYSDIVREIKPSTSTKTYKVIMMWHEEKGINLFNQLLQLYSDAKYKVTSKDFLNASMEEMNVKQKLDFRQIATTVISGVILLLITGAYSNLIGLL